MSFGRINEARFSSLNIRNRDQTLFRKTFVPNAKIYDGVSSDEQPLSRIATSRSAQLASWQAAKVWQQLLFDKFQDQWRDDGLKPILSKIRFSQRFSTCCCDGTYNVNSGRAEGDLARKVAVQKTRLPPNPALESNVNFAFQGDIRVAFVHGGFP